MENHIIHCDRCKTISVAQTKNKWRDSNTVNCRICGRTFKIKPFHPTNYGVDLTSAEATEKCKLMKTRLSGVYIPTEGS